MSIVLSATRKQRERPPSSHLFYATYFQENLNTSVAPGPAPTTTGFSDLCVVVMRKPSLAVVVRFHVEVVSALEMHLVESLG